MASRGPRPVEISLTESERAQLERWARRRKTAQALVQRSRIVLAAAAGESNTHIAETVGMGRQVVAKWRGRFARQRCDGLLDEPRPGRPRAISDEKVEEVIVKTLESKPKDATHWSTRSMAREAGLSQTAVSRIWRAFGLQPHRSESFKLSTTGRAPATATTTAQQRPATCPTGNGDSTAKANKRGLSRPPPA